MADVQYPALLSGAIQNTKSWTQAAGFLESDPSAGASYTQVYTEDQPTFLSFDLIFDQIQAQYFDSWARYNKVFTRGILFDFPVKDMYGISYQEVRFVSSGVPTSSEAGLVTSFSGCQIIIPDYQKPDPDMIISIIDSGLTPGDISIIDTAINVEWPVV